MRRSLPARLSITVPDKVSSQGGNLAAGAALLIIPASIADEAGVAAATPKYRD